MAPIEPGDAQWAARKAPLLQRVHSRGEALRRRAQLVRGLSVAAAVLLLAAVPAVFAASGGGHGKVRVASGGSTSTSAEPTTTPGVQAEAAAVSTTAAPSTSTTVPRTTTTALVCRNSYDPACGPFRWDPDPGPNAPANLQVTYSPASPKPGEPVTFHIVMTDPDAPIGTDIRCDGNWTFGPNSNEPWPPCAYSCPVMLTRYGPWTPPAREPGRLETDLVHTYDTAGTFNVGFILRSGRPCDDLTHPYNSSGTANFTVTVSGPPVSTTTTVH